MIVSFIHNKKKKQVKIDELESIFSIKNKINYIFFSESKKIEDIELFYNKNKLKNHDYCDKLQINENEKITIHLKTKGGGIMGNIFYYLICIIIIFIPVIILPSAFDALSSNLLGEILVKTKNNLSKYLVCVLGLKTLNKRFSIIIDLIRLVLFIIFTYVIITVPICVATFMAKGKTFSSNPKSLCSPLYVGTLTGLIFTVLYFLFYFMFRFSEKLLLPFIEYSKKNMLTNVLVRPIITLLYNIFNKIKYVIVYLIPIIGLGVKSYHQMIDSTIPPIFDILDVVSSIGCKKSFNINKIMKELNKKFTKNKLNNNSGNKPQNNNSENNNSENNNSENKQKEVVVPINEKLLTINFNDGIIDTFGIDQQLENMRKDLPNNIDPLCKEQDSSCCNVNMLKDIANMIYEKIEDTKIQPFLQKNGSYYGVVLAVQALYEKIMSYETINIDVTGLNKIQKKLKLKSIVVNDANVIKQKILDEINKVIDNPESNEPNIDLVFTKIYDYLHEDNLKNGNEKNTILKKIAELETKCMEEAEKEGSDYQKGNSKTKDFIKNIVLNSICNIFESANATSSLIQELGGVNNLLDILKCASASGSLIIFFYFITVIILIICGFLGIY